MNLLIQNSTPKVSEKLRAQTFLTVKSWVPTGTSAYMKKVSFSGHPKAKVSCLSLWHPDASRVQVN